MAKDRKNWESSKMKISKIFIEEDVKENFFWISIMLDRLKLKMLY